MSPDDAIINGGEDVTLFCQTVTLGIKMRLNREKVENARFIAN